EELDRAEQPLGAPGADRDVAGADPLERRERRARDERAGVVGGDDALARAEAGRRVAARRAGDPVLHVGGGEGDEARRPGRAARRVDPHELARGRAEVRAERVLGGAGRPELGLLGQRERPDPGQAAGGGGRAEPGRGELLAVEAGPLVEVGELVPVGGVVERELLAPRPRLDLRLEHQRAGGSWAAAASAAAASASPAGRWRSSARCARSEAVRARSGTALTLAAGKPRSSSTAAIGSETFSVSGFPHASATASRSSRTSRTCSPATRCSSASSRMRSARGSSGRCTGWPKPGTRPPAWRIARTASRAPSARA